MYNPSAFREERLEILLETVAAYPLAALVTAGPDGIEASHIPLVHVPGPGTGLLRGHLARANPHWKSEPATALAIFTGPQHYISPSWYRSKAEHGKVVPTWNYIAVHVRGKLTFADDPAWLRDMLETLTDAQEARAGTGWRVADAPRDFIAAQMRAIVGVELAIESIEGKRKLSQNRPAEDRDSVAAALEAAGSEPARTMARLVRGASLRDA